LILTLPPRLHFEAAGISVLIDDAILQLLAKIFSPLSRHCFDVFAVSWHSRHAISGFASSFSVFNSMIAALMLLRHLRSASSDAFFDYFPFFCFSLLI